MNTPETINIEKYAEALNELIGVDSAYMVGDKSVDAIVELIVAAKKLENRVKELTEENEKLNEEIRIRDEIINYRGAEVLRHDKCIRTLHKEIEGLKVDTVQKMQDKILAKSEYGTINISSWQLDQIAKEVLEENKSYSWIITENGCVITCPNCGERLELCYPDGTEVRYLPHCPWCGKKLEEEK